MAVVGSSVGMLLGLNEGFPLVGIAVEGTGVDWNVGSAVGVVVGDGVGLNGTTTTPAPVTTERPVHAVDPMHPCQIV